MNIKNTESMDITSFSKEELQKQVESFIIKGWEIYSGIDEMLHTNENGLSIITYSRTLIKTEKVD